jgi:hypothetical protein
MSPHAARAYGLLDQEELMSRSARSHQDALPAVLRFAALLIVAAGASVVASPLAGGVLLALGLVVLISYEATRPSGLLREAEYAPHPHGGRRHVLVVADAQLAGERPAEAIVKAVGPDAELDVLAPMLVSHAHYATSDHDAETRVAEARLRASLEWAATHGFHARGEVGDDEPATALADELRDFGADALIIVTDGDRRTRWAETRELKRARAELDIPVVHVVV